MYGYIEGKILKKLQKSLIIKAGQIGYEITVCAPLLEKIKTGEDIELHLYTHVREDELSLYGFATFEEKEFFQQIVGKVQGIGPKLGMELFSMSIEKIKGAIIHNDIQSLQSIPGVGKKIAERLIVEMKNKVALLESAIKYEPEMKEVNEEAFTALVNLGYQRKQIAETLRKRPSEIEKTEDIVRYFLQNV